MSDSLGAGIDERAEPGRLSVREHPEVGPMPYPQRLPRVLTLIVLAAATAGCGGGTPTAPDDGQTPDGFVRVTAGRDHSCGLRSAGDLLCWGLDTSGQLGDGSPGDSASTPVRVDSDLEFAAVVAGGAHTCALTSTGEAHCWGSDSDGQLGHGPNSIITGRPTPVAGGMTFTALAAGDAHTCGLVGSGQTYCWGANGFGQLGDGNEPSDSNTPVPVSGGLEFSAISAGGGHTCAVDTSGSAHCWGNNGTDQLGDGTGTQQDTPVAVQGGLAFAAAFAGGVHSCAVQSSGSARCWGFNFFGQLGDGTEDDRDAPTGVAGGLAFDLLSAGSDHSCGVTADGATYCWGFNGGGRLGDGGDQNRSEPTAVLGGHAFTDVAAGGLHTCAVTESGAAYCWGRNDTGQLGDGTNEQRPAPIRVVEP